MNQLAFETFGNRATPSLLLCHGFMSCNAQWLANREALAHHFHLVMVELWGHGQSPEPDSIDAYSLQSYTHQFEGIRAQLGISQWGLIGQSYGAGVMLSYAMAHPAVCPAVLVTNSRSAFGDISKDQRAPQNRPAPKTPRDLPLHPINARRFPQALKAAMVESADAMTMSSINNSGRLARSLNVVDRLAALKQPVMLANGTYESAFQQDVERLVSRYPEIEVVNMPGGHSVNIEAAEHFNDTAIAFFGKHLNA